MYCGIVLTGEEDERCALAFLDDDGSLETASLAEDEDILDLLDEKRPSIVAFNAPPRRSETGGFREADQDLIEEGHAVLPQGMRDRALLERAAYLARSIESSGLGAEVIETDPELAARELDISGDDDLADRGIEPSVIDSVDEFDAAVMAVLARKHADEETVDSGVVLPEGALESEPHERDADEPKVERDERSL